MGKIFYIKQKLMIGLLFLIFSTGLLASETINHLNHDIFWPIIIVLFFSLLFFFFRQFSLKKYTKELEKQKELYELVLEKSSSSVLIIDIKANKFIDCNKQAIQILKCKSKSEVLHLSPADLSPEYQPDGRRSDEKSAEMNGIALKNGTHTFEWKHLTATDEEFWVEVILTLIELDGKEVLHVVWKDIGDRKAAEEELFREKNKQIDTIKDTLETTELFQKIIIETMIDGLITINEFGIVESFNPAAEKIFGYQADEVIGENVKMLMPEPFHSEHDGYLDNYRATGIKKIIGIGREVEGKRKNGKIFPLDLGVSEMLVGGRNLYTGIVRDITERKEMEKMKNEFISTVSHELRTPLTSIRGSLGLLSGGAVGELPPQAKEMLKIAGNNTERLLLLINDILDIQKIESGQVSFKFQSVELSSFLEDSIRDHSEYGKQYGVTFVLKKSPENIYIYADRDRMMQVMANLLSNAAKFSPENETVEISAIRHDNKSIRISVSDHGPGIPENFQPVLFEKFTQSDSSDTRKKGGTGLGLNISKIIVERHGGNIGFVSREGIGTTFFFELPEIASSSQIHDIIPKQLHVGEHHSCILIVEDDADIAALLRKMLSEEGYNSDIAADANSARKLLKQNAEHYRAITLDLILPGEDGISLLQSIRKEASTYDIPVIVISVKANETRRELNGGAVGVIDWLQKPIDQERLIHALKNFVSTDMPRVLHVEDEKDVHSVISVMLKDQCRLSWTTNLADSRKILGEQEFDLVLLDIGLPDGSGLELLNTIEKLKKPPQVVIFSANDITEEYAGKVNAVLVKSKTNNQKLTDTIKNIIHDR